MSDPGRWRERRAHERSPFDVEARTTEHPGSGSAARSAGAVSGPLMPSFKFDPRDFIGPPYSRCSKCQKNSLGILTIGKRRVTRRCRECMTDAHEGLPDLDKKVVYLVQFVISNITRVVSCLFF